MRTLSNAERLKYAAAQEVGLLPKLKSVGWAGLTSAESGRIGGRVGAKMRRQQAKKGM